MNKSKQQGTGHTKDFEFEIGDCEFSTELVLSLNVPQSDEDLKRIRTFDEVKRAISKRPDNVDSLNNTELEELIETDSLKDLILLLRKTFLLRPYKDNFEVNLREDEDKFKIPLFTSKEKTNGGLDEHFINVFYHVVNEKFDGVIINPETDNFTVTKEMIG